MGRGENVLDDETNKREVAVLHKLTAANSIAIRVRDDELILSLVNTHRINSLYSVCSRVGTTCRTSSATRMSQ
jgi:hypothetical protein